MGQPAFQYDEFEDIEPIEVPAGGIATFLTATEGSWATDDDDDIPQAGIASVKRVADQLATFGRHEDEYMIHAAEGETVIPMEVFRKNPILKERIFQQMRDMGIEPERYVVGNELNSLNPVTGQPEFFLKKLFKGLKKFVKKAVTVVLPIVGAAFLGPLGAAAGSGIATLINGGNLKDALKSAALSGLTAGVMNGISGGMSAAGEGGSFFQGFKAGAVGEGAFTRTIGEAAAAGGAQAAEAAKAASTLESVAAPPTDPLQTQALVTGDAAKQEAMAKALSTPEMPQIVPESTVPTTPRSPLDPVNQPAGAQTPTGAGLQTGAGTTAGAALTPPATPGPVEAPGVMDSFKRMTGIGTDQKADFFGGARDLFMPGAGQRAAIEQAAIDAGYAKGTPAFTKFVAEGLKQSADLAPGAIRTFGPALTGILALDAFTREEPTDFNVDEMPTGFDLLKGPEGSQYRLGAYTMPLPTQYTIKDVSDEYGSLQTPIFQPQPGGKAEGGEIDNFPRMNGRIDGPGTETSDDIPAMLSDGEFVFTAKAVRGAGNGDRENGMKNMYALMSKFERMA